MIVEVVIPARLASTRLPRKVFADLNGQPLLWHVWQRAECMQRASKVFVATDAEEVRQAVESWGGKALMTSPQCGSGTERIVSALDRLQGDFILNVQGDEPLIEPALLDALVRAREENGWDLVTAVYPLTQLEDLLNPNVVKVVRAVDGRALYFSRSPVPYVRDLPQARWLEKPIYWGHVGVYGYRREVLEAYPSLPASSLEGAERLEQLRFLEAGYSIQAIETGYRPVAVDTAEDLENVRRILGTQE